MNTQPRAQSLGGFSRFTKHCAGTCPVGTVDAKMRKTRALTPGAPALAGAVGTLRGAGAGGRGARS